VPFVHGKGSLASSFIDKLYGFICPPIEDSLYMRAGAYKAGLAVRQIDRRAVAGMGAGDVPPNCVSCVRAILQAEYSDLIPCDDLSGRLWGLIVRTSDGKFFKVFRNKLVVFGLANLGGFKFGEPLVLVEGVKDALAVSLFYPYVLAYLTAQPPKLLLQVISYLTDKVLVFVDNDRAGLQAAKNLQKRGLYVVPSLFKDLGQLWEMGGSIKEEVGLYVRGNIEAVRDISQGGLAV